jgi:uncharacterized protein
MQKDVLNIRPSGPVQSSERHLILDILRGFALLGICLANYPEFSLYTFQKEATMSAMPTAGIDVVVKYLQYIWIDGKFYSLFSLLFGIGFYLIFSKSAQKGRGFFYRRMAVLALIGFLHLMFLWSGDILLLYAMIGMALPFFKNVADKKLIIIAVALLFFPVVMDVLKETFGFDLAIPVVRATHHFNDKVGINDENFCVWLRDSKTYPEMFKFMIPGAFIRCQEFIDGHRVFKVLGLFLLGLYIGRHSLYIDLEKRKVFFRKLRRFGFIIGLPFSVVYAVCALNENRLGLSGRSLFYFLSVVPLCMAYIAAICLWYIKNRERRIFTWIAAPGRMALTNYIAQSAIGMCIFYGIGFGLGASMGLVYVEFLALGVFLFQVIFSTIWMRYFQFGPLEWVWRMLTYGKFLKILK